MAKVNKTDYEMLKELHLSFTPQTFGIVNGDEFKQIKDTLMLDDRDDIINLRNLRNLVVLFYAVKKDDDEERRFENIDKCSAIVAAIDDRLIKLGGAV